MVWAVSLTSMELIPHRLTTRERGNGIRSLIIGGTRLRALLYSVLYPLIFRLTLVLKLYQGEPAISRFDSNFSSNHKSSKIVSTSTGSALHPFGLQPAHD